MKKILSFLVVLVLMAAPAIAHPGGTDGKGGHTDRSTGVYHYHHGYEAHQHEDGVCPYDFDDKTGEGSGSSSGRRSVSAFSAPKSASKSTTNDARSNEANGKAWEWILVCAVVIMIVITYALSRKEKRLAEEQAREQRIKDYMQSQQLIEEMLKAHERSTTGTQEQSEKRVNYRY